MLTITKEIQKRNQKTNADKSLEKMDTQSRTKGYASSCLKQHRQAASGKHRARRRNLQPKITPFVLSTVVFGGYLGILNIPWLSLCYF
jgi:hypothetical protein